MSELFDDIARVLAGPLPRRRAIFRAAGLLAGAALAGLRPAISQADTVCCDGQNRCCPPGWACCGEGPRGPNCCPPGRQCCNGACIPAAIKCCPPPLQACGKLTCCNTAIGQTCCDPQVGLCCPAGRACIVSGGRRLCGQPCGSTNGVPNFCVNGEVCCGSTCCPTGTACSGGVCVSTCGPPTGFCTGSAPHCGSDPLCGCVQTTEGYGRCGNGNVSCDNLPSCMTSADCERAFPGKNAFCSVNNTCCGRSNCLVPCGESYS